MYLNPTKTGRWICKPAVSGPIPEQLSALSLLTYLYSPFLGSQTAANAGIERGKGGLVCFALSASSL